MSATPASRGVTRQPQEEAQPQQGGTGPSTEHDPAHLASDIPSLEPDPAHLASDLRVVLGQLMRRLRAEHRFSISHGAVLGRLDREGAQSVSDLAVAEHVRPQSMAQTVGELELAGLVSREPDPSDGRRALVNLTTQGAVVLRGERAQREGWLAQAISRDFSLREQAILFEAVELLRRLAESQAHPSE